MNTIDAIGFSGSTSVTIENVVVECPFDDITDTYTVTIAWSSNGETVEFSDLKTLVESYHGQEFSQEALAQAIKNRVPVDATVTITGKHYGMETTVQV